MSMTASESMVRSLAITVSPVTSFIAGLVGLQMKTDFTNHVGASKFRGESEVYDDVVVFDGQLLGSAQKQSLRPGGSGRAYVTETAIPCEITICYAVFHKP